MATAGLLPGRGEDEDADREAGKVPQLLGLRKKNLEVIPILQVPSCCVQSAERTCSEEGA